MRQPIRIDIPHTLGREEARHRLRTRVGDLPRHIPGGVADVTTDWPDEDRMAVTVKALGQVVSGIVEVCDRALILQLTLPPMLSFMSGRIAGAIERKGRTILLGEGG